MADRFIRLPEVKRRVGMARSTIYRRIDEGDFPKPHKLAVNIAAWLESEIDAWVHNKAHPGGGVPG